jgi:hypothetical protein
MPMPKTSMYKNHGLVFGQHNVGLAGQIFHVQPVPEPVLMQKPPHQHLRLRILTPYPRHIITPRLLAMHIGHVVKLVSQLAVFSLQWAVIMFHLSNPDNRVQKQ